MINNLPPYHLLTFLQKWSSLKDICFLNIACGKEERAKLENVLQVKLVSERKFDITNVTNEMEPIHIYEIKVVSPLSSSERVRDCIGLNRKYDDPAFRVDNEEAAHTFRVAAVTGSSKISGWNKGLLWKVREPYCQWPLSYWYSNAHAAMISSFAHNEKAVMESVTIIDSTTSVEQYMAPTTDVDTRMSLFWRIDTSDGGQSAYGIHSGYTGFVDKENLPHGRGMQFDCTDNRIHIGEWTHGKMNGQGIRVVVQHGNFPHVGGTSFLPTADWLAIYEGQFSDSVPHGFGTQTITGVVMKYEKGEVCKGMFVKGKGRHGPGILTRPSGEVCCGEWVDGDLQGEVVETLPNGDVYVGNYAKNDRYGAGVLTLRSGEVRSEEWAFKKQVYSVTDKVLGDNANGPVYTGQLTVDDNKKHGFGSIKFKNGKTYVGQWWDNKKQGDGLETLPNGEVYDGAWRCDHRYGEGKLVTGNGRIVCEGYFQTGATKDCLSGFSGRCSFTAEDGTVTSGKWWDRHKMGTFTLENGDVFEGTLYEDFTKGVGLCKGTMEYTSTGQKYKGNWRDNKPHGQGTMTLKDGTIQKGKFADGCFVKGKMM